MYIMKVCALGESLQFRHLRVLDHDSNGWPYYGESLTSTCLMPRLLVTLALRLTSILGRFPVVILPQPCGLQTETVTDEINDDTVVCNSVGSKVEGSHSAQT
jgi:hypothetical protein